MKVAVLAAAGEIFSVLEEALEELGHEVVWVADGETRETTKAEVKINEFDLAIIAIAKYETDSPYSICRVLSRGTPRHSSRLWRQQIPENGQKYGGINNTQRLPALRNNDFASRPTSATKHDWVTPMQMTVDIDPSLHRGLAFRLTKRQIDVLAAMVKGKTNKQIARELGCSHATVRNHLTSIFKELGVSTRTEASFVAREAGLI